MRSHAFRARTEWIGAAAGPTTNYAAYSRQFRVTVEGKPPLEGSAAGAYRGDESLMNPEDLVLAALSACHLLSYLALCAREGILVVAYEDDADATMRFHEGKMRLTEAVLRPRVTLAPGADLDRAQALHAQAHAECFIANSVAFPVRHEAECRVAPAEGRPMRNT